jgi:hypothetical protein
MQEDRRAFIISAGGTPDALKEMVGLLRAGWRVVESRPANQVARSLAAIKNLGAGPFSLVVLERTPPADQQAFQHRQGH